MLAPRLIITLLCSSLAITNTWAQDSLLLHDYHFVLQGDPWLSSSNVAALTRFNSGNMSTAELSLTKAKGGFTDYYDSPNVLQADASVASLFRLSARTVVAGSMSYDNFSGDDMGGSAFLPPSVLLTGLHLPFDIVEDSLNTTGTKHRDVYRLSGAVGIDLWKGIALGARLDYTSANYAKYKDLRHKNKLMDLQLSADVYIPLASWLQLGIGYQYHRNTESLQFSTYGKSDRTYNSFINYGPYIGQVEQFGTAGYTDNNREIPLVNDCDGLSAQLSIGTDILSFYSSFDYSHRRGYYGRRSPYTITYTRHRSHLYNYEGRLSFLPSSTTRFHLDLAISAENLQNHANNYRELQNETGASYYEYYTSVKTANRLWSDASLTLTADLGIRHQLPTWTLQAGFARNHRKQTAYLYPYYRRQRLNSETFFASACRNIICPKGVWSLQVNGSFRQGDGEPYEDLLMATPSDKATPPPTMTTYLMREYLWLTAPQYMIGGMVKYAFILPSTKLKTYVKGTMTHHKSNHITDDAVGRDRTTATIAVGCEF